ncbi:MAG: nucleotide exchange factor GrpE [Bacillota bacterium]
MDDEVIIESDGSEERGGSEEELVAMESKIDAKVTKLRAELDQVKKEKQEYLDGWQRAKADYVNALKRFEDEKVRAQAKGVAKAARAFIGVIDTLERAEAAGEVPDAFKAVAKQLHDAATSLGLVQFGSAGETFDPVLHEALGQDPVDSADKDDVVTMVLESGWKTDGEVIRPAKVRVGHFEV